MVSMESKNAGIEDVENETEDGEAEESGTGNNGVNGVNEHTGLAEANAGVRESVEESTGEHGKENDKEERNHDDSGNREYDGIDGNHRRSAYEWWS